jgi:NAD(P)-dependent dehydrogenase (short-subunit alcohol dehydrogenase family)
MKEFSLLMKMCNRFMEKVAVITGAAQGIGEAIARRFVAEGGQAILADIEVDKLELAAKSLGKGVVAVETDVRRKPAVEAMAAKAVEAFGKIDILFNNAGILNYAPFLETTEELFDSIIAANLKGCFLAAQAVAKVMVESKTEGVIVNTASVTSDIVSAATAAYSASKGGVKQMTKVMALDLGPYNIRVNAFAPGSTMTRMTERTRANPEKMAFFKSQWAIKRLAEPEEQASVALFLASDDASYMTGEIVYVDGGWRIG